MILLFSKVLNFANYLCHSREALEQEIIGPDWEEERTTLRLQRGLLFEICHLEYSTTSLLAPLQAILILGVL